MTPCRPQSPRPVCHTCARLRTDLPHLAECRPATIVIDATVVTRGGICPLHEARSIGAQWWHDAPRAHFAPSENQTEMAA